MPRVKTYFRDIFLGQGKKQSDMFAFRPDEETDSGAYCEDMLASDNKEGCVSRANCGTFYGHVSGIHMIPRIISIKCLKRRHVLGVHCMEMFVSGT